MSAVYNRFKVFCRVVIWALFAGADSGGPIPQPDRSGTNVIPPESLADSLAGIGRLANGSGDIDIYLLHCPALAAPFILFRLKRTGFSRCRARADQGGLHLIAAR